MSLKKILSLGFDRLQEASIKRKKDKVTQKQLT